MATYATLTVPVADIIGAEFNTSRASVWIEPNTPVVLADSIRVGGRREQVTGGVATFTNLVTTDSADNPTTFGYRVTITAPPKGAARREDIVTLTTSDFPLTATANLKDIPEAWDNIVLPVAWRSAFRDEMTALESATAAHRAAVENVVITDLGTTDGQTKTLIETDGTLTKAALSATIAAQVPDVSRGQRAANFIAVLSDSIGKGVYEGDYQEGIDGSGTTSAGASWLTFGAALSGGKIVRAVNASVIGNTTAQMLARVQADVIDHPSAPAACVVMGGYNDAEQGLGASLTPAAIFATYISNITAIVEALQSGGVVPVLATPLPTSNNATIADILVKMALWTRRYAAQQGIALVDFQAFATDPATGAMKASIKGGGDGVHPSIDGQLVLGQFFADQISPSLPPYKIPLVSSPLDDTNLIPNGLFAGTPTDGKAPSVFQWGSLPSGVTNSITTDTQVAGNLQRVTHAGSTVEAVLAQRIPQNTSDWSPGDRIAFSGIITASGMGARIETDFNAPPYGLAPIRFATGITRGYWYAEVVVAAGIAVDYIDVKLISGPGTGYVEFGQLTAYNLTKLGLV